MLGSVHEITILGARLSRSHIDGGAILSSPRSDILFRTGRQDSCTCMRPAMAGRDEMWSKPVLLSRLAGDVQQRHCLRTSGETTSLARNQKSTRTNGASYDCGRIE